MEQLWVIRTLLGKIPLILKLLLAIFTVAIISGGIIHLIEPVRFPSLFDGLWWALVTVSTVGYGDFVPESIIGRTLATLLIFTGVGIMTLLVTSVASIAFSINQSTRHGELAFLGDDHIIIIGWNERSKHAIQHIGIARPGKSIVLIDESLLEIPKGYRHLHFVKGNSTEDAVLKQANIGLASSVLITAKQQGSEFSSDARTILTTLAVKCQNPDIYAIVEVLTKEQLENARRAGANECIESTTLTGAIFVTSLLYHHMSDVVDELFTHNRENKLSFKSIEKGYINKPFSHVFTSIYERDIILIGIIRCGKTLLHPPATTLIKEHDKLIIISRTNKKV